MINTNFGKLVNGVVSYAESPILLGENLVWTNDETIYAEQGYFPVVLTDKPVKKGYCYTDSYVEQDGRLVQVWEEHKVPKIVVEENEVINEENVNEIDFVIESEEINLEESESFNK